MYELLEKDDYYELHLGDITVAKLLKGVANSEVIAMTAAHLQTGQPVRCADFLAGVSAGLTHAALAGRPRIEAL